MSTRSFMSPHLMTQLRVSCVKNNNLSNVFDTLKLNKLLESNYKINVFGASKDKADVIESIIGELARSKDADAEGLLQNLLSFIAYTGDAAYFDALEDRSEASVFVVGDQVQYEVVACTSRVVNEY